jgi:uncharacterized membrane protein YhhN
MSRTSTTFVGILIGCAILLAIAGHICNYSWLLYTFKPLATLLVIGIALANWISQKKNYALWIAVGLVFSLAGDILLMWPERFFVGGLGAFLFAHIAYLAAFTRGVKFPASWAVWIFYLVIGTGLVLLLNASLPDGLKATVAFYAFALATMAAQATGRYLLLRSRAAMLAAAGGIFFMVSDGLLAVDRFRAAIPYAAVVVLVPYYVAQFLIALSTQSGQNTNAN